MPGLARAGIQHPTPYYLVSSLSFVRNRLDAATMIPHKSYMCLGLQQKQMIHKYSFLVQRRAN